MRLWILQFLVICQSSGCFGLPLNETKATSRSFANILAKRLGSDTDGEDFRSEVLNAHNKYRKIHGSPELSQCGRLRQEAYTYALGLSNSGAREAKNDPKKPSGIGQNVYVSCDKDVTGTDIVDKWYEEVCNYFGSVLKKPYEEYKHFAQIVWRATQLIGIGKQLSADRKCTYMVVRYNPGSQPGTAESANIQRGNFNPELCFDISRAIGKTRMNGTADQAIEGGGQKPNNGEGASQFLGSGGGYQASQSGVSVQPLESKSGGQPFGGTGNPSGTSKPEEDQGISPLVSTNSENEEAHEKESGQREIQNVPTGPVFQLIVPPSSRVELVSTSGKPVILPHSVDPSSPVSPTSPISPNNPVNSANPSSANTPAGFSSPASGNDPSSFNLSSPANPNVPDTSVKVATPNSPNNNPDIPASPGNPTSFPSPNKLNITTSPSNPVASAGPNNPDGPVSPDMPSKLGSFKEEESTVPAGTTEDFEQSALSKHNFYREHHNAPALTLNEQMSNSATEYAKKLSGFNINSLEHSLMSSRTNQGESIFTACGLDPSGADVTKEWYVEECDYDYNKFQSVTPTKPIGHFTQVVWKSTKELGIGKAYGTDDSKRKCVFIVARYKPAGNIIGSESTNVGRSKTRLLKCDGNDSIFNGTIIVP